MLGRQRNLETYFSMKCLPTALFSVFAKTEFLNETKVASVQLMKHWSVK